MLAVYYVAITRIRAYLFFRVQLVFATCFYLVAVDSVVRLVMPGSKYSTAFNDYDHR